MEADLWNDHSVQNPNANWSAKRDSVELPVQKYASLLQKLQQAEDREKQAEEELQQTLKDLQQMRHVSAKIGCSFQFQMTFRQICCIS